MFKESNPILKWNRRISNAQLPSFFSLPVSAVTTSQAAIRTGSSCPSSSSSSPSSTTGLVAPRVPQPSGQARGLEGERAKKAKPRSKRRPWRLRWREKSDNLVMKLSTKRNIIYLELIYSCIYGVLLNYAGVG